MSTRAAWWGCAAGVAMLGMHPEPDTYSMQLFGAEVWKCWKWCCFAERGQLEDRGSIAKAEPSSRGLWIFVVVYWVGRDADIRRRQSYIIAPRVILLLGRSSAHQRSTLHPHHRIGRLLLLLR